MRTTPSEENKVVTLEGSDDDIYTENEERVGNLWGEVFGLGSINIDSTLYDLGGDSIIAINLVTKLIKAFEIKIEVSDIFENSNVRKLAVFIDKKIAGTRKSLNKNEMIMQKGKLQSEETPKPSIFSSILHTIDNLSWRKMNCFDKALVFLVGKYDIKYVYCFQALLGLQRGYNLAGLNLGFNFKKETELSAYPTNEKLLQKMGFNLICEEIVENTTLHNHISSLIEKNKAPVVYPLDEYFLETTPYYHKKHTNHMITITDYIKDSNLYSIMNYFPDIQNNDSINYGEFLIQPSILSETTDFIKQENKQILYLEAEEKQAIPVIGKRIIELIEFIISEKQIGADINLLYEIINYKYDIYFEQSNLNELYFLLGGKELIITLAQRIIKMQGTGNDDLIEKGNSILKVSGLAINQYAMSIFRAEMINNDKIAPYIEQLRNSTTNYFQAVASLFNNIFL
jgi:acyl carrier protein